MPNPSFEQYDTCPNTGGQLYYVLNWINPLIHSSPDYFNVCGSPNVSVPNNIYGNEPARTGDAYCAIVTGIYAPNPVANNGREYLQVELQDTMVTGVNYCIRFYVSACDSMQYISNNIGIYFSNSQIQDSCYFCILQYLPQFENPMTNNLNSRNGWTEVSGSYQALGGERFMTIGNFRDSNATTLTYTGWGLTLNFSYHSLYYVDDVLVTPCDSLTAINEVNFHDESVLFPNPFSDKINITTKTNEKLEVILYDVVSRKILNQSFTTSTTINTEQLAKGIYLYEVRNKSGVIKQGKVVKE